MLERLANYLCVAFASLETASKRWRDVQELYVSNLQVSDSAGDQLVTNFVFCSGYLFGHD